MNGDLKKNLLYESVKQVLETDSKHLHFTQHKLYTLFSIAFQTILFKSTKAPGAYIVRVENSMLAEKLARKSKDPSTRKFIQSMLLPRKLKYGKSTFFIDFFHLGSWNLTNEIPPSKLKGAIIIKSTSDKVMDAPMAEDDPELDSELTEEELANKQQNALAGLPKDYYLSSLLEICPETITIDINLENEKLEKINFPFIKKEESRTVSGVTLGKDINWDVLESDKE